MSHLSNVACLTPCADTDMNAELKAHGLSNLAAGKVFSGVDLSTCCPSSIVCTNIHPLFLGAFGGLPNYMTYSNSLLYAKSNVNIRLQNQLHYGLALDIKVL